MIRAIRKSWAIKLILLLCATVDAKPGFKDYPEVPKDWKRNLDQMGRMEELGLWSGPWPDEISIDHHCAEGKGCLRMNLSLAPRDHLRIEHNFMSGFFDGFQNMMGHGMEEEDLTSYHTISFAYRTDSPALGSIVFRIWDRHSVVADPLFVDPAHDDYRLKPESPALKLGFKPIPIERIGPYADKLRASWPIVGAVGSPKTSPQPRPATR